MAAGKLKDWAAHRCASCDAPGTIVCREGGWRNYLVCSAECGEPQWSACTVCAGAGRGPGGCHKAWQQHSNRSFHRSNLGRRGGGGEECAPCGDGDDGGDGGDVGDGDDGGGGAEALGLGHGMYRALEAFVRDELREAGLGARACVAAAVADNRGLAASMSAAAMAVEAPRAQLALALAPKDRALLAAYEDAVAAWHAGSCHDADGEGGGYYRPPAGGQLPVWVVHATRAATAARCPVQPVRSRHPGPARATAVWLVRGVAL